ncbi:hypothetical protein [Limnoglobus roseus]|uniref:TIGR03067 domain-containing protein n=1 Tax=Limnoglobus roseus TaxID=2598579 RepID=A0A5C1AEU7_9BACT|nr:hypothetical protein [Limnoglobus roseus]QEL17300.1 TIGR03067 domain-containing protein [Limnoglobus roseus]
MPVPITCSGCSAKMTAPDAAIGKRVTCPQCKTSFVVPDPNASEGFEVVEEEVLDVAEIIEDDPAPPPVKPAVPTVAKAVPASPAAASPSTDGKRSASKVLQKNLRRKKQVDASDYLTKVNGKPIALRPGETPPPPIPRKSSPRE